MKFSSSEADIFVPDGATAAESALARTTHLCIAAHQDDIEIMAYHGIAACFGKQDRHFTGVVVTNGAGSPRAGIYEKYSDEEMRLVRRNEQRKAACVGEYSLQIQLSHSSSAVREPENPSVQRDLRAILSGSVAEVVYLHQPADKHDTHIAVLAHSISAIRSMPAARRPKQVFGCEVWRDLDWLCDADKRLLDVGSRANIAAALVGVFDSQISGGKRYDLASAGRRLAHATYHTSHATDQVAGITWAMDLTPLINDSTLSVRAYALSLVENFRRDVDERLAKFF